jgi:hypothetical protein
MRHTLTPAQNPRCLERKRASGVCDSEVHTKAHGAFDASRSMSSSLLNTCPTHAGVKLADASKKFGKKFASGASVVKVRG